MEPQVCDAMTPGNCSLRMQSIMAELLFLPVDSLLKGEKMYGTTAFYTPQHSESQCTGLAWFFASGPIFFLILLAFSRNKRYLHEDFHGFKMCMQLRSGSVKQCVSQGLSSKASNHEELEQSLEQTT